MRNFGTELPYNLHVGIPQLHHAVLDAEGPLAAEGLATVIDANGLPFGDAFVVVVFVAPGADGVVDALEAELVQRGDPVQSSVGRCDVADAAALLGAAAGAAKTAAAIGDLSADESWWEEEGGQRGC